MGGVIRTERRDGFLLEAGPDSFISEKPEAVELAKRIGLTSRLIETNEAHRRSFIVRKGRPARCPGRFSIACPFSLLAFCRRQGFLVGRAKRGWRLICCCQDARAVNGNDDESLAQFVRRRLGREALERMAQPMVGGIYTADPEKLSLARDDAALSGDGARASQPDSRDVETAAQSKRVRNRKARAAHATASFSPLMKECKCWWMESVARLNGVSIRLNTKCRISCFR